MEIRYGNLPDESIGKTGIVPGDFTDERYKYELMWTGGAHAPATEQIKQLKRLGLLFKDGTTPTVRKASTEQNSNDGSGCLWYITNKNWRTLGMMENELGLSSQSMMEFYGYGRPEKALMERYACEYCSFVAGSQVILDHHIDIRHPDESAKELAIAEKSAPISGAPDQDRVAEKAPAEPADVVEGSTAPKCQAKTASGDQCKKDAIPGSDFCGHPAHAKLGAPPETKDTVTTSDHALSS